ncbi:hypothetical protein GCM10010406_10490 [Streptomyces thermolineatus]|uniref:Uncharacterized protein n=1 Tax=Streptomyces thermolineatus TaxID=44033 RepID=A0ABN3L1X4_9ACTN
MAPTVLGLVQPRTSSRPRGGRPAAPCPSFLRHSSDTWAARLPVRRVGLAERAEEGRRYTVGVVGGLGKDSYPQALWTTGPRLWRSPPNLCTARGKELWTSTQSSDAQSSDLRLRRPLPVHEKNFPDRTKITTNGAPLITLCAQQ